MSKEIFLASNKDPFIDTICHQPLLIQAMKSRDWAVSLSGSLCMSQVLPTTQKRWSAVQPCEWQREGEREGDTFILSPRSLYVFQRVTPDEEIWLTMRARWPEKTALTYKMYLWGCEELSTIFLASVFQKAQAKLPCPEERVEIVCLMGIAWRW